jgi:hypothetical protein
MKEIYIMRTLLLSIYLFITSFIIIFNILYFIRSGTYIHFISASLIIVIAITIIVSQIICKYEYKSPIMLEIRQYPTCMEIIVDGKDLFIFSSREEMYERILAMGFEHILIKQPVGVFGYKGFETDIVIDNKIYSTANIFIVDLYQDQDQI